MADRDAGGSFSDAVSRYWQYLLSLPKTIYFNFKLFPFRTAAKLPVFISHNVVLRDLSGEVELGRVERGIVKIGFGFAPIFDNSRLRTVMVLSGKIVFKGSAFIGPGCQLGIAGALICGDGFAITANTLIAAKERVEFGKEVIISWDVIVADHDWHQIRDREGTLLNAPRPVVVGDKVWICSRALVLKGSKIASGVVVAAGATVSGRVESADSIVGRDSALRILKKDVRWER